MGVISLATAGPRDLHPGWRYFFSFNREVIIMAISPEDQKSVDFAESKMAFEEALKKFADAAVADDRTVSAELEESFTKVFDSDSETIIEEMT